MGSLIDAFTTEIISVTRISDGEYINGRYSPGQSSTLSINASVQAVSGRERLQLPELYRKREVIKLYTSDQLFTSDEEIKSSGDRFTWRGKYYEVFNVESWMNTDIPHYKSMAMLIDYRETERDISPPVIKVFRITEDGLTRETEEGLIRILEG